MAASPASIVASVGAGGVNRKEDAIAIQTLLNKAGASLKVDGAVGAKTIAAIKGYQSNYLAKPDGKVDPGGLTLRHLNEGKLKVKAIAAAAPLVLLPQVSGEGYYSYSAADRQWGTSACIKTLQDIATGFRWNLPAVQIAIGDISFAKGGTMSPHGTHKAGLHVDLRPLRADAKHLPVTIADTAYSREYTKLLVQAFQAHKNVKSILFNDTKSAGVTPWAGHDNHLHVTMKS
jgi:peptidoglycan hydrolase-like protein with peptidoglycan-binding domain